MKSRIISILYKSMAWIRGHRSEIIYYSSVLSALAIIAVGAEVYRRDKNTPEPVSLPAVEITLPEIEEPVFQLPQGMHLQQTYSAQPRWNEPDQSWQAHPAADYTSEDGIIRAFAGGTILEVGVNAVLGEFMLIETGDIQMKYCNIKMEDALKAGEQIRRGETIGFAGNSMPGEIHLNDHLHLEAYRQGQNIDPESLLQTAD